jgi:predicted N-acetyltransferase YhbS
VTTSPHFRIRSPQTSAEIETFFRLNAQVFRPDEDTALVAAQRLRFITEEPDFRSSNLRGAFLGDNYVGGYILIERWLCLGSARLLTGCISGVVTHPDYRHQGIARALMLDAINYTQSRHHALLFLHGLSNFYHQFGYIDVLEDMPKHYIDRKYIPEQPVETCTVRSATVAKKYVLADQSKVWMLLSTQAKHMFWWQCGMQRHRFDPAIDEQLS